MALAVGVFMAACSNVPVWTALTRGAFVNPQLTPIWLTLLLLIRLAVPSLSVCRAASELVFGSSIGASIGLGIAAIARAANSRNPPDAIRATILTSMALPILFVLGLIRYRSLATAVFGLFLSLFFGLAVAGSYRSDIIWTYPAFLILYVCLAAASALVACYVLAPLPSTLRCFRSVGASLASSATIVTAVAEAATGPHDPDTGLLASVRGELHPTMLRVDAGLREFVLSIVNEAFAGSQAIVAAQTFSDAARGELDLYSPAPVHPLRETFVVTMLCRDVLATAFASVELIQDGRISVRKICSPDATPRIRSAAEGIARALRGAGQAIAKNERIAEGVEGLKDAVHELVVLVAMAVGDEPDERERRQEPERERAGRRNVAQREGIDAGKDEASGEGSETAQEAGRAEVQLQPRGHGPADEKTAPVDGQDRSQDAVAMGPSESGGAPLLAASQRGSPSVSHVRPSARSPPARPAPTAFTSADHLAFRQAVTSLCTTVSRVIDLYRVVPALIEPWQPSAREVVEEGLRGLPELRLGLAVAQHRVEENGDPHKGARAEAAEPSSGKGLVHTNLSQGESFSPGRRGGKCVHPSPTLAPLAVVPVRNEKSSQSQLFGAGLRAPGLWEPQSPSADSLNLANLLGLADRVRGQEEDARATTFDDERPTSDADGASGVEAESKRVEAGSRSADVGSPRQASRDARPVDQTASSSPSRGGGPHSSRIAESSAASPRAGRQRSGSDASALPPRHEQSESSDNSTWAPALGRREVVLLGALVAPLEVRKAPLPQTPVAESERPERTKEEALRSSPLAPDSKASTLPLKSDLSSLSTVGMPAFEVAKPQHSRTLASSVSSSARAVASFLYGLPSTLIAPVCSALAPFGVRTGHVRLAIQLCLTYFVCLLLVFCSRANDRLDHGRAAIWTAMSALGIADSSSGAATRKALFRTVGTLAGGAVALGILYASNLINGLQFAPKPGRMISTSILLSITLGINAAFASRSPPSSYVNIAFGIIVGAASLAGYVEGDTWRYALYRIAFTLVGVVLHSIVSVIVLPVTARDRYRAGVAGVLRATGKGYEHLLLAIIPPAGSETGTSSSTGNEFAWDGKEASQKAAGEEGSRMGAKGHGEAMQGARTTEPERGEQHAAREDFAMESGVDGSAREIEQKACQTATVGPRQDHQASGVGSLSRLSLRPRPTALTTPASIYTPNATFFSLLKAFVWQAGLPLRADTLLLDDPWPIGPRFLEMYADFNPPSVALAGQRSFLALFPYEWSLYERPHRIKDASPALRLQLVLRRILNTMVTQATALDALGILHLEPLAKLQGPLRDVAAQLRACLDAQALALDRAIPPSDAFALLEDLDAHTRRFFLLAALSVPLADAGGRDVRHTALLSLAGSLATVSTAARQSARCIAATFWGEDSAVWAEAEAKLGSPASWTVNEELELAARNALGNEFAARVRSGDISFIGSMWEAPTRSVRNAEA